MTILCKAIGIKAKGEKLGPLTIERRECAPDDVLVKISYAGICHSDIHTIREEWSSIHFPAVVGHEITGIVEQVGSACTKFKVGDVVGVGCYVDSCRTCANCKNDMEQYCKTGAVFTYDSKYKYPHCAEYTPEGGNVTFGGYSERIVVQQDYVLHVPEKLHSQLAAATPLLCAGITVYSPYKVFGLKPGHKLAVYGMGGLGHMGVKLGKAFGAHVTVISRGLEKRATALALGADEYIDSKDSAALAAVHTTFDFILNTVSAEHDMTGVIDLLGFDGTLIMVGAVPEPMGVHFRKLIGKRKRLVGSLIGGIAETQEMLDFCAEHNVVCDIEMVALDKVNEAYDRAVKGDVKYRFVMDMSTL